MTAAPVPEPILGQPDGDEAGVLAAAKALHAASVLGFLRWEQLDADVRAEFIAAAEKDFLFS